MLDKLRFMVIFVLVLSLLLSALAFAVPSEMNYQGKVTDTGGNPLDGKYAMKFRLYNALTGGTQLWNYPDGEEQSVLVTDGIYNVSLGVLSPLFEDIFSGDNLYLEVLIYHEDSSAWETLSPRQHLTSTAFAFRAANADALDGFESNDFAIASHNHDASYVNENQEKSITSAMIVNGSITAADLATNSVNASEIAPAAVGVSEIGNNAVGSAEIIDHSITAADIYWSLIHTGSDDNGGLIGLTNTANGSSGNYPAALSGGTNGDPAGNRIFGVLGGAPGLGYGSPVGNFPLGRIGVGGASSTGYGVAGVTSGSSSTGAGVFGSSSVANGIGVRGEATFSGTTNYGGWFKAEGSSAYGVFGRADGSFAHGVHGYSEGSSGVGVFAYSQNGDGLYATTSASDEHAGYFYSATGTALNGASLYTRNANASGIALYADHSNPSSADATAVIINLGSGALLKGFGGNGGENEFQFDNSGTLFLYNEDHIATIVLDPSETGTSDGGKITLCDGDGNPTIEIDGAYNGDGRITTEELQVTGGSDLSEQFDIYSNGRIEPGMIVSIDPENPGKLRVAEEAYDKKVAGIISGAGGIKTGMMMGQKGSEADGAVAVALTGRVYCWVDTGNGAIIPGDLLTSSARPGYAMKVSDYQAAQGAIIGKAMTALQKGDGLVLVLVTLQ